MSARGGIGRCGSLSWPAIVMPPDVLESVAVAISGSGRRKGQRPTRNFDHDESAVTSDGLHLRDSTRARVQPKSQLRAPGTDWHRSSP